MSQFLFPHLRKCAREVISTPFSSEKLYSKTRKSSSQTIIAFCAFYTKFKLYGGSYPVDKFYQQNCVNDQQICHYLNSPGNSHSYDIHDTSKIEDLLSILLTAKESVQGEY